MSSLAHYEEQRRRLDHFMTVAHQARAKNDIVKIQELINELVSSKKCLPNARINELKYLELMTSPYNQTLISMLRVENATYKQHKELEMK